MENDPSSLSSNINRIWKEYLSDPSKRKLAIGIIIFLAITLFLLTNFLSFNETREGAVIDDPILALFEPINLTWSTFALIYLGLLIGIYHFSKNPRVLLHALLTYTFLALIRICLMYSLPLEPPAEMISLNDPFVELFGTGKTLDKDLFFSGHTSTMFMLFLLAYKSKYKKLFLAGTFLVGASVILQHAHYTVDVLVAPFIAYAAYKIAGIFMNKF